MAARPREFDGLRDMARAQVVPGLVLLLLMLLLLPPLCCSLCCCRWLLGVLRHGRRWEASIGRHGCWWHLRLHAAQAMTIQFAGVM